MFKKVALLAFLMIGLFLVAGVAMAQEEMKESAAIMTEMAAPETAAPVNVGNKVCPVTGEKVSGVDTVEYEGKAYNLCCPMCKAEFLKDPAMYIAKVEAELAAEQSGTTIKE